mmetsp:Transcript_116539/g.163862  ORF Transcript_116539/g.163862 Transcript_116539/m.163862 type:complete len:108 (+) Transcript_116539:101-424(+)
MSNINYNFEWTNFAKAKEPAYLAKHPLGKIPLIETPEGNLIETHAIMRYFARKGTQNKTLLGKNAFEEAIANQWLEYINIDLFSPWCSMAHVLFHFKEANEEALKTY